MRKVIFIVTITLISTLQKTSAQTSDTTLNALLAIDENQFIGKPVDSIMAALPSGYIQIKIFAGGHQYTARKIGVMYPNRVWVELHVREFTHMNPRNDNKAWDIALMRKEKLYKTVIYKSVDCFRNCDIR